MSNVFTGIIQALVPVKAVARESDLLRVSIAKPNKWRLTPGRSVAVDGVCSTVVKISPQDFTVEYMPETLRKTTLGSSKKGKLVNLERSLTLQDPIDGHIVQGHVDAAAEVIKTEKEKNERLVTIALPRRLSRLVAAHGSIAVNGVSLTVARKQAASFTVAIIAYTLKTTNLNELKTGDKVNIEVDILARYLETLHN